MNMKMIMAVVPRDEAEHVLHAIIAAGHTATFSESRGGILRQAQYMLFIALQDQDVQKVLDIINESCHSQVHVGSETEPQTPSGIAQAAGTARVGGAAVFVWDLEQFRIY